MKMQNPKAFRCLMKNLAPKNNKKTSNVSKNGKKL